MSNIDIRRENEAKIRLEYERYYQTVHLTLGLKHYLDNKDYGIRFVSAEPILKCVENDYPINPDFLLQYDEDRKGILGEIKTSIPFKEEHYQEHIDQLMKYCKIVEGWDTPSKTVDNHEVLCLIYTDDSDRFVTIIKEKIAINDDFSKKICITEFSKITSFKIGEGDVFLLKLKFGKLGFKEFEKDLIENIKNKIDELQENYEVCKFTRKEPPIAYLLDHIWQQIFPLFAPPPYEKQEFEVELSKISEIIHQFYVPWSGIKGEYSQIRDKWIKKAMEEFVKIKLAEKIDGEPLRYKIFFDKQTPKDIKEYIIKETVKVYLKKQTRPVPAKGQITLIHQ